LPSATQSAKLRRIKSRIIKSASKFGSALHASSVWDADAVLKPACSNRLLYRLSADESSSTKKTDLEALAELFVVIVFGR
jgi:hypothetical protein